MSWSFITEDWRMKLLALGLAVLMLGAVAFSQNLPTSGSLKVPLNYAFGSNTGIVILNPPSTVTLTYTGLADAVSKVSTSNLTATVNASKAKPGTGVTLTITASTTVPDLHPQSPTPIVVNIDSRATKDLPVTVNTHAAAGWAVTKAVATCPGTPQPNPCVVHFDGPQSWESSLTAAVNFAQLIQNSLYESPNQPIQLSNSNGLLDLTCRTQPCALLDTSAVNVHVEAVAGSTSSTVTLLDAPPSHGPASGYRVTGIDITPNTVNISGDPGTLGKIRNITLPAVDLSGRTSTAIFQVAIPYPDGVTGTVANANIKYTIAPNPNASPGA